MRQQRGWGKTEEVLSLRQTLQERRWGGSMGTEPDKREPGPPARARAGLGVRVGQLTEHCRHGGGSCKPEFRKGDSPEDEGRK